MSALTGRCVRVHLADPDFCSETCAVKFVLSYEGELKTSQSARSKQKRRLRNHFHSQLKRLWNVSPILKHWYLPISGGIHAKDWLLNQTAGFDECKFIPLVTAELSVECALELRICRPSDFAGQQTDIDNQIKVVFDSLKIPDNKHDIGDSGEYESPLYILLKDDDLVTKISSVNDELLAPVNATGEFRASDVRMTIDVHLRPRFPNSHNVLFFSDDQRVWDHQYSESLVGGLRGMSNAELSAVTTQLIYRITAFHEGTSFSYRSPPSGWVDHEKDMESMGVRQRIWRSDYQPKAFAIKQELQRRVYGDGPYPSDIRSVAIDHGMLAGVSPISDAALELQNLVSQL